MEFALKLWGLDYTCRMASDTGLLRNMSNWYGFNILPFDWRLGTPPESKLPISVDDFVRQLQIQCPCGKIVVVDHEESTSVRLYVSTDSGDPWIAANLILGTWTNFEISAYPKTLALQLLSWYRKYVALDHRLFVVVMPDGDVVELTEDASIEDFEALYLVSWMVDSWKGC